MFTYLERLLYRIHTMQVNDVREPSFVGRLFVRP